MFNARIIHIDSMKAAIEEIRKIGADESGIPWLCPKAVHFLIKLEGVSPYAANIIKQEMLGKGGDAVVNRGVIDCSVEKSDIIIMGTLSQYKRLLGKLDIQSGSLKEIAAEIQKVLEAVEGNGDMHFACRRFKLPLGRKTYIMGILNVTPDSFSDGGRYSRLEDALDHARRMVEEGADIIDVGGESTRPGFEKVSAPEEINRVIPVVERLVEEIGVPVSVDTMKACVAEKALKAGADIINDVWGLQGDSGMAEVVANYGAGVIMMHNRNDMVYRDLMGEIAAFLQKSISIGEKAGIPRHNMVVDPGIGFGKTTEHNLEVMRRLKELKSLDLPLLIGTSRKSMIGNVLGLPVDQRLEGTAATVALGIAGGADIVRVHDVGEMARVARMTDAIVRR